MKKIKTIISILLLSTIMFGCRSSEPAVDQTESATSQKTVEISRPDSRELRAIDDPVREETVRVRQTITEQEIKKPYDMYKSLTEFSFNMFRSLSEERKGENIAFSPVSLNIAFAMVYAGAREITAKEISEVIGFPDELSLFYEKFGAYHNYLGSLETDTAIEFNLANRVFLEREFEILEEYRHEITKYFEGAFQLMDFMGDPRGSEMQINDWVEKMTKNRIKNLLPTGTIDELTRMILVNAIYIKSGWKNPFNENRTTEKTFHQNIDKNVQRDFMIQKIDGTRYAEVNNMQILELEYDTRELSMLVILPAKSSDKNINDFIPTAEEYKNIVQSLRYNEVYMEIPKFKIESSFNLNEALKENGIVSAFYTADFSGITGERDLEISDVLQKVFFEVDEKGSEAAAATAIVMRMTSSAPMLDRPEPKRFIANRPFIYILKENNFHTPLFIGQFTGKE